jgi:Flp pilus assembly protein TadG
MGHLLRRRRWCSKGKQSERGQSVVEFALVIPLMVLILLAIADFGRIYTTIMSVESAAREAADFGTTLGAPRWSDPVRAETVAEMEKRACVAASNLPDYAGDDPGGAVVSCTNPSFSYCVITTPGGACAPYDPSAACDDPLRTPPGETKQVPCQVQVTLSYDFHLITPLSVGFPSTINFHRDSTFAITDIDLEPGS